MKYPSKILRSMAHNMCFSIDANSVLVVIMLVFLLTNQGRAVADYLEQDENAPTSAPAVNTTSSAWKEDLRCKVVRLFTDDDNDNDVEMDDSDSDESFYEERPKPKVKGCRVALDTIDDLTRFVDANTDDIELKRALAQATECLKKLRLKTVSQKKIVFLSSVNNKFVIFLFGQEHFYHFLPSLQSVFSKGSRVRGVGVGGLP